MTTVRKKRLPKEWESTSPSLFPPDFFELGELTPRATEELNMRRHLDKVRRDSSLAEELKLDDEGHDRIYLLSFGSGSSGNCCYLGTLRSGVLIDAGVDFKEVEDGLSKNGIDIDGVAGILLTHDHSDHVSGAYALLRRHKDFKLYATPRAMTGLLRRHNISRRIKDYHQPIYIEHEYEIGPFKALAFSTLHDGTDNMGFSLVTSKGLRIAVATDMGAISERADFYLSKANHIVLEANYDETMLVNGRYAEYLKARIRSEHGHLDNKVTASYLARIVNPDLRQVWLCHLSEDNNTPEIALGAVRTALEEAGVKVSDSPIIPSDDDKSLRIRLSALPRYGCSELFALH